MSDDIYIEHIATVFFEGPAEARLLSLKTEGPVNLGVAGVAVCMAICRTPELHASHAAAEALALSLTSGRPFPLPTITIRNDVPPKGPKS